MGTSEKLAIVVDGKDICRIIPFQNKGNKLELKFSFLHNKFVINTRKLFASKSVKWDADNLKDKEITYHKYIDPQHRAKIHIKSDIDQGPQYSTLPLKRIVSPNIDGLLAMPLVKIEIPEGVVTEDFASKKKYKTLRLEKANIVEIFMYNFNNKNLFGLMGAAELDTIGYLQMILPIEFYASGYTGEKDGKGAFILPQKGEKNIFQGCPITDSVGMFAIYYFSPIVTKKGEKLIVTFIENELAEEMLLTLNIYFPNYQEDNRGTVMMAFEKELSDMKYDSPRTTLLYIRSQAALATMQRESKIYIKEKRELIAKYYEKVKNFYDALKALHIQYVDAIQKQGERNNNIVCNKGIVCWFDCDPSAHSNEVHLLLSKYLDVKPCIMYMREIKHETYHDNASTHIIKEQGDFDKYLDKEEHYWLIIDDKLDIDICLYSMKKFFDNKLKDPDEIGVFEAACHKYLSKDNCITATLCSNGYIASALNTISIDETEMSRFLSLNNGKLQKIYDMIVAKIYSNGAGANTTHNAR